MQVGYKNQKAFAKAYPGHWLADAEWEDATISVSPRGIIWHGGIWKSGVWEDGIWRGGVWEGGIWRGGVWEDGRWADGTWMDGTWKEGLWKQGRWAEGTWEDGTWYNGYWMDGTWESGTWNQGDWGNGTWLGGLWRVGTWKNGVWKGGTWANGNWKNGTWEDGLWGSGNWWKGVWKGGVWKSGGWHGGKWDDPRSEHPHQRELRKATIKLAHAKPELRAHLLPILANGGIDVSEVLSTKVQGKAVADHIDTFLKALIVDGKKINSIVEEAVARVERDYPPDKVSQQQLRAVVLKYLADGVWSNDAMAAPLADLIASGKYVY